MRMIEDFELFGNTFYFEDLYRWIQTSIDHPNKTLDHNACLILTGSPGVGKTYSVEKICQMLGITIKKIDSSTCHSAKELDDLVIKMASTNLVDTLLQQNTKKILFIDEFEVLLSIDRNIPSILYQRICSTTTSTSLPYIPIIIACNSNVEKKLGDLKRYFYSIYLKIPTDTDVMLMLLAYTKKNNISISAEILLTISESTNGNMLHALNSLEYELLKNKESTNNEMYLIDRMPNIDTLYNNPSPEIAYMLFEEDLWMNPLRFHENLPAELDMRKGTKVIKAKIYSEILQCMMEWDHMIHTDISNTTNFISTEHLCKAPCYLLKHLKKKKHGNDTTLADFTKALSQMSLHKKMEKQSYQDDFPWKHIGNYFYTLKKYKQNKKHPKNQKNQNKNNKNNKKFSSVDTDNST